MPNVLTINSTVECGHHPPGGGPGGAVQAQSAAKLTVAGGKVLLETGINGMPVSGCPTVPKSDASGPIDVTCTIVSGVTAGAATKLTAGGLPVILDTLGGGTNGLVQKQPQNALAGTAKPGEKLRCV